MRIVAGEFKGRVIKSPDEATTRPTTDRVREAMFSSINSRLDFEGTRVLDAFSGSGALGLEALSRGADSCVFIEQDAKARKVLDGNIKTLQLSRAQARVLGGNTFEVAQRAGGPFGLVLLDPPYVYEPQRICELLESLRIAGALADGCVVVYEHAATSDNAVTEAFGERAFLQEDGQKKYGKIKVSYFTVRL